MAVWPLARVVRGAQTIGRATPAFTASEEELLARQHGPGIAALGQRAQEVGAVRGLSPLPRNGGTVERPIPQPSKGQASQAWGWRFFEVATDDAVPNLGHHLTIFPPTEQPRSMRHKLPKSLGYLGLEAKVSGTRIPLLWDTNLRLSDCTLCRSGNALVIPHQPRVVHLSLSCAVRVSLRDAAPT